MNKVRTGIIGVGKHGETHLKLLKQIPEVELVGFYEVDPARARQVSSEYNLKAFSSPEDLLNEADAVDIVSPASTHDLYVRIAFNMHKHIFVEKPPAINPATLEEILKKWNNTEKKIIFKAGMVERYNPAYIKARSMFNGRKPILITSIRRSPYPYRCTDVSVIYDIALHDIDIFADHWGPTIATITAFGKKIISRNEDIVDVVLSTKEGVIFHIYASRVSPTYERKMLLYFEESCLCLDFLERACIFIDYKSGRTERYTGAPETNPLLEELRSFFLSIVAGEDTIDDLKRALASVRIAHLIQEKCRERSRVTVAEK